MTDPVTEAPATTLDSLVDSLFDDTAPVETAPVDSTPEPETETTEVETEVEEPVVLETEEQSLAEMLGLSDDQIDTDSDGNLVINTKVDGVTETVNFKEVLAGFQTNKHNTQKSQAIAEERRAFESQVQAKATEIKQNLDTNTALTSQLYNELVSEYKNTDWDTLRATDPAEWSARQQDFKNRNDHIQKVAQTISQQRQAGEQQIAQQTQAVQANYLKSQRDLMVSNNPDWADDAKLKTGLTEIKSFLAEKGFTPEDMATIQDARAVSIIQDAMKFRAGATVADRKIKAAPKAIKSTGRKSTGNNTRLSKLTKAAQTAKGATRISLQDEALAELFS